MGNDRKENFLRKVKKVVYDSSKKESIAKELEDMIEDLTEFYINGGLDMETAQKKAIEEMGKPEEIGSLFNQIYRMKFDWKMLLYMLLWAFVSRGLHAIFPEWEDYLWWAVAVLFMVNGIVVSVIEKWTDSDFFYAWGENWNGGGITNSGLICGIAIGAMPITFPEWIFAYVISAVFLALQRGYMVEKRNQKEQKYLWETAIALEDFEYKGKVECNGKKIKVQMKKGKAVCKNESVMIVGMNGFTLIADHYE